MSSKFLLILPVAACIVFLTVYGTTIKQETSTDSSRYTTALRLVGHKLLLSSGDSASRVLPVHQIAERTYQLRFEKPFSIQPDSLVSIVKQTALATGLPPDYSVNVLDCKTRDTVYSFIMANDEHNTFITCLGRDLPTGCYYITFTFAKPASFVRAISWAIAALLFSFLLIGFYRYTNRKKQQPVQAPAFIATGNQPMPVGRFVFHFDQRYLSLNGQRIDLTDKETKLLSILAAAPNQVVNRDQLQKEVWENEGVIVTRSLDVFISKLRKKLKPDAGIRIVNIHGKGYKLELETSE